MAERSFLLSRLLLRLLPSDVRRDREEEFHAACAACLEREAARLGPAGLAYGIARLTVDACVAAVLSRIDARRSARIAAAHAPAAAQGDSSMASLWQDVRYAVRTLGRAPVFSAVAILTLAVTIGAITAIFSVVNGVLLRSMPFADPGRLAILYEAIPKALPGPIGFSAPDYVGFEQRARSFSGVAAFSNKEYELSGITQPERVTAARVSATLFDVLGIQPRIGRAFTRDEDLGRVPVAILSDGLWRRSFGADATIVGRAVVLDRQAYTVVGVMPPTFVFPNRGPIFNNLPADLYVPISFTNDELGAFGSMYNNTVVGRLAPGVAVAQADAEARAVAEQMTKEIYPAALQQMGLTLSASVVPLRDETVGRVETLLYVLLAAVGVVLLIACADLANLMLTRAAGRQREMAVRTALGAARSRLARQVLVEAGLLAAAGGLLGVPLAYWGTRTLIRLAPDTLPRLHEIGLDGRVLAFAAAASIVTALLCGVLPAIESSRRPGGHDAEGRWPRQHAWLASTPDVRHAGDRAVRPRGRPAGCRRPVDSQLLALDVRQSGLPARARAGAPDQPPGGGVSNRTGRPGLLPSADGTDRTPAGRRRCRSRDRSAIGRPRASRRHARIATSGVRRGAPRRRTRLDDRTLLRRARDRFDPRTVPLRSGHPNLGARDRDQRDDGEAVLAGTGSTWSADCLGRKRRPRSLDAHRRDRRRREAGSAQHADRDADVSAVGAGGRRLDRGERDRRAAIDDRDRPRDDRSVGAGVGGPRAGPRPRPVAARRSGPNAPRHRQLHPPDRSGSTR